VRGHHRIVEPLCHHCKHKRPWWEGETGTATCPAFPEGIPDDILKGLWDHREPLGDEQTLFEPREGVSDETVADWEKRALVFIKQTQSISMGLDE